MKKLLSLIAFLFIGIISIHAQIEECVDPDQINLNAYCDGPYDPVCGCDGVTYYNPCQAHYHGGVTSWTEGECPPESDCQDLEGIDFGPCDLFLGYATIGGECVGISGCGYIVGDVNYSSSFYNSPEGCAVNCTEEDCIDLENVDFGPCDLFLGYALIGGECVGISGCGTTVDYVDYASHIYPTPEACEINCFDGCVDLGNVDFGTCDLFLGYAIIDGTCQGVSGCSTTANGFDYSAHIFDTLEGCEVNCIGGCLDLEGIDFGPCDLFLGYAIIGGQCIGISGCGTVVDDVDYANYIYSTSEACEVNCTDNCVDLKNVDFGPCDMFLGYALIDGACHSLSGCGTVVDNIDYSSRIYSSSAACEVSCIGGCVDLGEVDFGLCDLFLGYAFVGGTCQGISGCGTTVDDIDYSNHIYSTIEECQDACGGGPCFDLANIDFGPCDLFLGYAKINGICQGISGCGYIVDDVDYTNSFFATLDDCGNACTDCNDLIGLDFGDCALFLGYAIVGGQCTGISGCGYVIDDVDYSSSFYPSELDCENNCTEDCVDLLGIDFGDCDLFLGYALINGSCVGVSGCGYIVDEVDYTGNFYSALEECQVTCTDECVDVALLDFGLCDQFLGFAIVNGVCTGVSGCGYEINGVDYSSSFFNSTIECENNCTIPCEGDANGDGVVDILDFLAVSSNFGCNLNCTSGDANGDGVVDILDLLAVSSNFGTICP